MRNHKFAPGTRHPSYLKQSNHNFAPATHDRNSGSFARVYAGLSSFAPSPFLVLVARKSLHRSHDQKTASRDLADGVRGLHDEQVRLRRLCPDLHATVLPVDLEDQAAVIVPLRIRLILAMACPRRFALVSSESRLFCGGKYNCTRINMYGYRNSNFHDDSATTAFGRDFV